MSFVLLPSLKITANVAGSSELFAGEADFSEGFEFAESWPNTSDNPEPTASFVTADFYDSYEGSGGWPNAFPYSYTETIVTSSGDAVDGGEGDQFGVAVDITPDASVIAVGASAADDPTGSAGSVTVLKNNGSNWYEEAVLTSSLPPTGAWQLGGWVTIVPTGDRIFAGQQQYFGSPNREGSVVIFDSGSSGWEYTQLLTGSGNQSEPFGAPIDCNQSGERLFVGFGSYTIPGLGGSSFEGSIWVYNSGSSGYELGTIITSSGDWDSTDSVRLKACATNGAGDRLIGGSRTASVSGSTGTSDGMVEFFRSGSGGWYQEGLLSASVSDGGQLGNAVDMSFDGDRAIAGANLAGEGKIYVFNSGSGGWNIEQVLTGSNITGGANLGVDLVINDAGDTIFAGAYADDTPVFQAGSALIFRSGSSGWYEEQKLTSSYTAGAPRLGIRVAMSADQRTLAAGAYLSDISSSQAGHVSIFEVP